MVPDGWEEKRLGEICTKIGDGIHATPKYVDNSTYYFINGNNLLNYRIQKSNNTKYVSELEYKKYITQLNDKTILMSINGTIGNLAFYNNEKVILGKSVCYIILKSIVIKNYVFFILQSRSIKKFFENELTGTTINNLSLKSIRNTPILLPPLPEQKKIAAILSSVDEVIQATQKVIDQTKLVKKGLLQELLTKGIGHRKFKKVKLGMEEVEIPVEWEVKKLGEVFKIIKRPCDMEDDSEYELITVKRRHEGIVSRGKLKGRQILVKSQFYIQEGDFVISKRQIVHGACEIVPKSLSGSIVSNEYSVLNSKSKLDLNYLNWFSRSALLMKYFLISSIGVHIEKMLFKIEDWFKLQIALPPLPEQKQIAAILGSVDNSIHQSQIKLTQLKQLKKGLMQDLLTGKVRVKI